MTNKTVVSADEVNRSYDSLNREAEAGGYHLNPDVEFTIELVTGLLVNEKRYGYSACPCRLASGEKQQDIDIICPCNYRDLDLSDYQTCYCGLYVSEAVVKGQKKIDAIPERRLPIKERKHTKAQTASRGISSLPLPVWRCKVCGYSCARQSPPEVCPICEAKKDRFERFI